MTIQADISEFSVEDLGEDPTKALEEATEIEPQPKRRGRPPGSASKKSSAPPEKIDTQQIPGKKPSTVRKKRIPRSTYKMSEADYARLFQALHAIPAGLLALPPLYVTETEAMPVGVALQTCAEFYGWDFVEKMGPAFMLCITIGALELKVAGRVRAEMPLIREAKREAKRRKTGDTPVQSTPEAPVEAEGLVPTPVTTSQKAQALKQLQNLVNTVPETGLDGTEMPMVDLIGG